MSSSRVRAAVSDPAREAVRSERRRRIEADLERLGVAPEVRSELARRLEALDRRLPPEAFDACVAGAALAHGLHRDEERVLRRSLHDLEEIQRLIGAFGEELRKLDEALRILSTYVRRMRTRTGAAPPKVVH